MKKVTREQINEVTSLVGKLQKITGKKVIFKESDTWQHTFTERATQETLIEKFTSIASRIIDEETEGKIMIEVNSQYSEREFDYNYLIKVNMEFE